MSSGTPFNYTRTVCSGERKEAMVPAPRNVWTFSIIFGAEPTFFLPHDGNETYSPVISQQDLLGD